MEKQRQTWGDTITPEKNTLILSGDIDSLLSCHFIEKIKGVQTSLFYNFESVYSLENYVKGKESIGVDIDFTNDRLAFGNHVTFETNSKCINFNHGRNCFKNGRYTKKFNGSTLVTVLDYYQYDISTFSKEQIQLILCVDVAYKGYYIRQFKQQTINNYKQIHQGEIYLDVLENTTLEEFEEMFSKYKMYKGIKVEDGKFVTELPLDEIGKLLGEDITLPQGEVKLREKLTRGTISVAQGEKYVRSVLERSVSHAMINTRTIAVTYRKRKNIA